MRGCARCRRNSWRATRRRRGAANDDRDRRSGAPRLRRRARDRFCDPGTVQCEPNPVRQSRKREWRPAGADRSGRNAQLRRALRGSLALGQRLCLARPEARRSYPDVPRRYAGLSGGVLRRGTRRFCTLVDQHADAAGPAAILSVGFRRQRCGRRWRVLLALRQGRLRGDAVAHADRGQRRGRRTRRAGCDRSDAVAQGICDRPRRSRHPPQRDGVLDVFIRLDRPAQGHRAPAARHGL